MMTDLTTASVYCRRIGTNVFEFVRTELKETFDRLAGGVL